MLVLSGKIISLQIIHGNGYRAAAEGNRERIVPIPAERGIISDRLGRALTMNIPSFSLALTPQQLPRDNKERQEMVRRLAGITKRSEEEIWGILDEYGEYSFESIIIQEHLDYNTALSVQIAAADLPGIQIVRGSKRLYLHTPPQESWSAYATSTLSLSHIIGYEGKLNKIDLNALYSEGYLPSDFIGKTGIEKASETYLRGEYGKKRVEVNAFGREQSALAEVPPVPGSHITLAIDAAMQATLESLLKQALAANRKKRASAVALNPNNGEVLALVSLPDFDNNDFSGGIPADTYRQYTDDPDRPLFPRAIGGTYPSGSTIKPAIAAAALQDKIITKDTVFLSTGGLRVGQWFFPDWLAGGHGWTNVISSLANSVNTFYYYVGGGHDAFKGLGVARIEYYLRLFGFGTELGIDIPGEASGFVPSEQWKEDSKGEMWYIGDTYNLSIGQGDLLVTPLQIAAMTSVVANGGTLYRPHLVREIVNPVTNETITVTPTIVRSDIATSENLAIIRAGMRACATSGSCRRLSLLPFEAAGKTGTAQWRADKENHGWFTSFAPYDHPEIVLTILVEEGGEGSGISAPIAKDFYQWWWQYRARRPVDNDR
jgi:penicillin-binding protein 2